MKADFTIKASDGVKLAGHSFLSEQEQPKAVIVLVHGLGEHMGRYHEPGSFLGSRGIAVYGCDLRGHGRTKGKRGHAEYPQLLSDLANVLRFVRNYHADCPIILYGHSMGGNIAASYVLEQPAVQEELHGLILSAPWFALKMKTPVWALAMGQVMYRLHPSFTQDNGLDPAWLSKDERVGEEYLRDPLVHGRISAGLFLAIHKRGKKAIKQAAKLHLPTLVMHGDDDAVTSDSASRKLAEKAPNASFKSWPGLRHEPHNELEKEEVMEFVYNWIRRVVRQGEMLEDRS